jgi:radical SAM-linked protein
MHKHAALPEAAAEAAAPPRAHDPAAACPSVAGAQAGAVELERQIGRVLERDRSEGSPIRPGPVYRYRASFEKLGRSRFLGHLDLVRALNQSFRRAGVQLAYSGGFRPRPKLSLSPALGLGIASHAEYLDFETHVPVDTDFFVGLVNDCMPEGLRLTAVVALQTPVDSLQQAISRARYRARFDALGSAELRSSVQAFHESESVEVSRVRKDGRVRRIDLKPLVRELEVRADGSLRFTLAMSASGAARPGELIEKLVGERHAAEADIERTEMLAEVDGRLVSPLLAGRMARSA